MTHIACQLPKLPKKVCGFVTQNFAKMHKVPECPIFAKMTHWNVLRNSPRLHSNQTQRTDPHLDAKCEDVWSICGYFLLASACQTCNQKNLQKDKKKTQKWPQQWPKMTFAKISMISQTSFMHFQMKTSFGSSSLLGCEPGKPTSIFLAPTTFQTKNTSQVRIPWLQWLRFLQNKNAHLLWDVVRWKQICILDWFPTDHVPFWPPTAPSFFLFSQFENDCCHDPWTP